MRALVVLVVLGCAGAKPSAAVEAPQPARFRDHPVGVGTCKWISVGEASEIIGQQLQYLEPDEQAFSCVLVPATGDGPVQVNASADAAWEARPNVWVTSMTSDPEWSPPAGIGDRSVWESDDPYATLFIGVGDTTLKIDVNLPRDQMPARAAERRQLVEAVARKVHARLKAHAR